WPMPPATLISTVSPFFTVCCRTAYTIWLTWVSDASGSDLSEFPQLNVVRAGKASHGSRGPPNQLPHLNVRAIFGFLRITCAPPISNGRLTESSSTIRASSYYQSFSQFNW